MNKNEKRRKYYKENKTSIFKKQRIWRNKKKSGQCIRCGKTSDKRWFRNRTLCRNCYRKVSIEEKPELLIRERKHSRKRRLMYPEQIAKQRRKGWKKYYQKNRRKMINRVKLWQKANLKHVYKTRTKRAKVRRRTDLNFRLMTNLRARMRFALKRGYKKGTTIDNLGCSINYFRAYIEKKFKDSMSWDNYGKWELDHTQPLSSFDLTDKSQYRQASHYTNYQPLWGEDNRKKADKIQNLGLVKQA